MSLAGVNIYDDERTGAGYCRGSRLAINRVNKYGREYIKKLENAIKKRDQLKSARESREVKAYKQILLSLDIELARANRDLQLSINRAQQVNLDVSDLVKPTSLAGWFDCDDEQRKLKQTIDYVTDLAIDKGNVEGQIAFYEMLSKEGLIEIKRLINENKKEIASVNGVNNVIKKRLEKYYAKLDNDKLIAKHNAKTQINTAALKSKDNSILMGSLVFFGILFFVKKVKDNKNNDHV